MKRGTYTKLRLVAEPLHGSTTDFRNYLAEHDFFGNGLNFTSRSGKEGRYLLLHENMKLIADLNFGNTRYAIELPVDLAWLEAIHHTDEVEPGDDLDVTNRDHYNAKLSLAGDKVLVKITEQNFRVLALYIDFNDGDLNLYCNGQINALEAEFYNEPVEVLDV
jgi:hypothetical protein